VTTSLYALRPEACARAEELLKALKQAGIQYAVTSTRRTTEEQIALYCQGRAPLTIVQLLRQHAGLPKLHESENGYTVTKADGVNDSSAHQDGRALDLVVLEIVDLAKPGEPARRVQRPSWDYAKHAKTYRAIADIARARGWTCGADWPPVNIHTLLGADPPHFQI